MKSNCNTDTTIESILNENSKLATIISHLEEKLKSIDRNMNELSPMYKQIQQRNESLTAAINFALTEYPSSRASVYLAGVMENLFQK
jgi:predicted transcriptional regulator